MAMRSKGAMNRLSVRVAGLAWLAVLVVLSGAGGGCASGRLEVAAADLLEYVARQNARAIDEYHRDLRRLDAERQRLAVAALVSRVRRDGLDSIEMHAEALLGALEKLDADRDAAWVRYDVAMDNVRILKELAADLRGYGLGLKHMRTDAWGVLSRLGSR